MIIILAEKKTARLSYILHHVFEVMLGMPYRLCTDPSELESLEFGAQEGIAAVGAMRRNALPEGVTRNGAGQKGVSQKDAMRECADEGALQEGVAHEVAVQAAVLNYTANWRPDALFMPPHPLLFEEEVHALPVSLVDGHEGKICFPVTHPQADVEMDVFAACFYFLSRYEEYLHFTPDGHGRFRPEESVAFRGGCLQQALVDRWVDGLKKLLQQRFPQLVFPERKAIFTPTYDIDVAFAFKCRSWAVRCGAALKSLLKADFKSLRLRRRVLSGAVEDPYDVYGRLAQWHETYRLNPLFFILSAPRSTYDRGLSPKNRDFALWLGQLAAQYRVGIHFSYISAAHPVARMRQELELLSALTHREMTANRFHYLHFRLPDAYKKLVGCGIKDDYSMGFVSQAGFRAGSCTPFAFFDLLSNTATDLKVHPLLFMENALPAHQTAEEWWEMVRPLLEETLRYGGEAVSLFHNQSFGSMAENAEKYTELYLKIINYLQSGGAHSSD